MQLHLYQTVIIIILEWDEREEIPDPDATKPEDWDKPEHIADPDATKPDDWDDDMDGEWEAPMVDNPDFKGELFHINHILYDSISYTHATIYNLHKLEVAKINHASP